jgi:hypothetical protein
MDEQTNRRTDVKTDRQTNGRKDGQTTDARAFSLPVKRSISGSGSIVSSFCSSAIGEFHGQVDNVKK